MKSMSDGYKAFKARLASKRQSMTKKEFMQQFTLNRALGRHNGMDGIEVARGAEEVWEYIEKVTP